MKPRMSLAHWGWICVAGLAGTNIAEWILFPTPRQGPLNDRERGELLGLGVVKVSCLVAAAVCFVLHFTRGRAKSRRRSREGLSRGAVLAIVAGAVGAVVLVAVLVVSLTSGRPKEKPRPSPTPGKQEDVNISVPPPAGLDRLEKVWVLLNIHGDIPIKEL